MVLEDLIDAKPIKSKNYTVKQSKLEIADTVPFRSFMLAPSNSGKITLIVHLILKIYRNVFERVYIWSPSIFRDPAWKPVIEYIKNDLKVDNKKRNMFIRYICPI